MARFTPTGTSKIYWVPAVADMAAPTAAEITAGDDFTGFLREFNNDVTGSQVDVADLSSRFDKTAPGTWGASASATLYQDDDQANDTAYTALKDLDTEGYFIVARRGGSGTEGAVETGDYVDVWHVQVTSVTPSTLARGNEPATFTVEFSVPSEPVMDVAVAV